MIFVATLLARVLFPPVICPTNIPQIKGKCATATSKPQCFGEGVAVCVKGKWTIYPCAKGLTCHWSTTFHEPLCLPSTGFLCPSCNKLGVWRNDAGSCVCEPDWYGINCEKHIA
eukprot:NODE_199_length_13192_cov_0.539219.p11 type:complete len:114 gc:universal NODE_199_length_13192_cov_0.539219:2523-2182(-)